MNNTVSLDVVEGIIDALKDTLEKNKTDGILNIQLFSGFTQDTITKTQGRTYGAAMHRADCHQFISRLSTRRDQAKMESGLTKLVNEIEAGQNWISETDEMLEEIDGVGVQHVPVYSDVPAESDVNIRFAALDSGQIEKLKSNVKAGKEKLAKMGRDAQKLTDETRVTITTHEQKKLKTLIPGFEHAFPIAIGLK